MREEAEIQYTVEDLNATQFNKKKRHEIAVPQPSGKLQIHKFEFHPGRPTKMPQEIALLFLDIAPTFRVRNSRGQIVRPRKFGSGTDRTVVLRPHELAVPVTGVLKEYLHEIARAMPGGLEKVPADNRDISRQDLEEFVISGGATAEEDEADMMDTVAA